MPDPVTIATGTTAILSFLNLAKIAIRGIFKDVDRYTNYSLDLKDLLIKLRVAETKLDTWRQLWRIDERLGLTFWKRLWGENYASIESALNLVLTRAERVWGELESRLGLLANSDKLKLRQYRRENRNHGFWTKLCDSLFRGQLINEHLLKLDQSIDQLEEFARHLVRREHGHDIDISDDTTLAQWLGEHFNEEFLSTVAHASQPYSAALYQELAQMNEVYRADIVLERLLSVPNETDALTDCQVGAHSVVYDIIYQGRCAQHGSACSHLVLTADTSRVAGTSPLSHRATMQSIPLNATGAKCSCVPGPIHRLHLPSTGSPSGVHGNSPVSFVNHANAAVRNDVPDPMIPSGNLRVLLQDKHNDFIPELHGDVTKIERTSLAYHLALFTFLLIHTGWTSQICSCVVSFTSLHGARQYHICVGSEVRHLAPTSKHYSDTIQQWCEELGPTPIRRLGLLLTEIAIGSTIFDATVAYQHVVGVDFDHFWDGRTLAPLSHAQDVRERVALKAGTTHADVVRWCLTQRLEPVTEYGRVSTAFYHRVLQPLSVEYRAIVKRDAVLHRTRRQQK